MALARRQGLCQKVALSENDVPGLMTRRQAAAYMGVSITTVDRMIKFRELESVKIRGAVRVSRSACVAALNRTTGTRRGRRRMQAGAE